MPDPGKTRWDKAATLLQQVGGSLTALAVAFVGILGSCYLNRSQANEAKLRLYTELMSRREQSDTALREEMFKSIVGTFLEAPTAKLEQKVFSVELLADNFHESLEISPLFRHVLREVEASNDSPNAKAEYKKRLELSAQEVAVKQIEILQESGDLEERGIAFEDVRAHPEGMGVLDETFPLHSEDVAKIAPKEGCKLDEKSRCIRADVLEVDQQAQRLRLSLVSTTLAGERVEQLFWLDLYDLPMVNNTRLSHDQRMAVVLRGFKGTSAQFAFVYFPGSHAGLQDKPC